MALDRTLIQIRERSFLELLDLALVVLRDRPWALGKTAALGIAPWAALYAGLAAWPEFPAFLLLALVMLASPWATAPLTVVLGGLMFGDRPPPKRIASTLLRALPALMLYQGLLRAVFVLIPILIPIILSRYAFLNEVILLERNKVDERARQSVDRRCGALCGDRGSELFGHWLIQVGFGILFVLAFRWAASAVVDALVDKWTWDQSSLDEPGSWMADRFLWFVDLRAWATQLAIWITVAFFGVARFLSYIDQRIRLEGWEVELRLRAAGAALEDANRW
ncbi:MAG: hypothetical protein ABI353_12855 [Isosphaeraceae bacterium]